MINHFQVGVKYRIHSHELELVTTELKKFQWYLTNSVEDDKRIPKSQLENADRHDTVDKMVQKYGTFGAVNMTEVILKKMGNNQLAEKLRTTASVLSNSYIC
uniref:Pyrin domain-containing protein n=1 Tax=Electrophorus electricus TaxID=8005 RepID=A0A4W4FD36_ELEEL